MPVTRHFLGWDSPLVQKVCDFLLNGQTGKPVDLGDLLILVPTRQAGRRLRQALAARCDERGTGLLSPHVAAPADILGFHAPDFPVASATIVFAVWNAVLGNTDVRKLNALFPVVPPSQDIAWTLHLAEALQDLRKNLAEAGTSIAEVVAGHSNVLVEAERWADLAKLEKIYLDRMKKLKLSDPCAAELAASQKPSLPEHIRKVMLAGVSDLSPLVARALERLAPERGVQILVHAPQEYAKLFDEFGRPMPEAWGREEISITDPAANIRLAASPAGQARVALQIMEEDAERYPIESVAVGVPDPDVTSFLATALADKGHKTFDPAGRAIAEHPLFQLLDALRGLVAEGRYPSFSSFARHIDVLVSLRDKEQVQPSMALLELDDFQNTFLPADFGDIARRFRGSGSAEKHYPNLFRVVRLAAQTLEDVQGADFAGAVRRFFQRVYAMRQVNPNTPRDEDFLAVARELNEAVSELETAPLAELRLKAADGLELLVRRLRNERYYPDHSEASLDFEGWLELAWNDAPLVVVTGFNEGILPDSRVSDVFLPDKLRVDLGLRNEAQRCARDAFLLRSLVESRNASGRVCLVAGKTSSVGDPLRPSRLLFRCKDDELPARCRILFGDAPENRPQFPASASFRLNPLLPDSKPIEAMSVTAFRSYLACPFRFYLSNALGMESADDRKSELDELDFGTMVHESLQRLHGHALANSENERDIAEFLQDGVQQWLEERFGADLTLQMRIQGDAAQQRLRAAARLLAQSSRDGWELVDVERKIKGTMCGMEVRGRIDRIERHRASGAVRLLDFKSSDKPADPIDAHIESLRDETRPYAATELDDKQKRWIDLQLPLYRILLENDPDFKNAAAFEIGYFNLPKALTDTRIEIWKDFDARLARSAFACAEGVIKDIQGGRFWPPTENMKWDDFEMLFHGPAADAIEPQAARKLAGKAKVRG